MILKLAVFQIQESQERILFLRGPCFCQLAACKAIATLMDLGINDMGRNKELAGRSNPYLLVYFRRH